MNIWIFNNYIMQPKHGQLNRHFYISRQLAMKDHDPVVFAGSHPHNSDLQLVSGKNRFEVDESNEDFKWVNVKTVNYEGSTLKRAFSMVEYYVNAKHASKHFGKPDAVLGSTPHPLAAVLAIKVAKKHKAQSIVEVRDLWPESIVAYDVLGKNNPIVIAMRGLEKWMYKKADKIAFLDEGDYDYIIEQGWDKVVDRSKVYYLSNGVDLELFNENKEKYTLEDEDLDNPDYFNIVYTGSIRKVNNLGLLLDVAKLVKNEKVKFLIWGRGNEVEALEQRLKDENITNVKFKGFVEKKYVPYITSKADLNLVHNNPTPLFRFGISFNKIFDYMAAGKPILSDFICKYNPTVQQGAGMDVKSESIEEIAELIDYASNMDTETYNNYCENAKKAAQKYSYDNLSSHLIDIINGTAEHI